MNYKETLQYIHSLGNFSLPATLERINRVLDKLGNPQNNFKTIHIAGTNGKGSVSAMVSSVLKTAGIKTGLFISPFIINFRERIQINGEYISEQDLVFYAQKIIETNERLTEFEFITAVAFLYFKEKKIEILVCETGLGGRFDATNAVTQKIVTVITKVGLDHTAILGDTVEKIAEEKCGILKDCPTVTTPFQDEKALSVIRKNAKTLYIPDLTKLENLDTNTANEYIYKNEKYLLNLLGNYQIENSLVAIETIKATGFDIPYNIIYKGLSKTNFPARMEVVSKNPLIILDGAHNPDGARALAKELKKFQGKATAIIAMMKDKDCDEVLKETLPLCANAVVCEVDGMPRSLKKEELLQLASKYTKTKIAKDYHSAISLAKEICQDGPVFVYGSLYLAAGIRPLLKEI